jgi:hypothetical protein
MASVEAKGWRWGWVAVRRRRRESPGARLEVERKEIPELSWEFWKIREED